MKATKQTERKIRLVQHQYQEALLRKSNVVGLGIGEKKVEGNPTGRLALVIFVEKKVPMAVLSTTDQVEKFIEGVETDVVEIGRPELAANTTRLRPAIGGISTGHVNLGGSGTFGCLLRSETDGQLYILSCNHVFSPIPNMGRFGDAILQPGPGDGGVNPADRIATLFRYPPVSQSGNNIVDCALGRPVTIRGAAPPVRPVTMDAWSDIKAIPGWFGAENQGGDIALFDIANQGQLDLVVFHLDNPGGENHGYYRIGWGLDPNGNVTRGWSNIKPVPGWFGAEDQGAGIAIADISGNGQPDLVVFHLDNPGGENHGYYRIGWNLDANGDVTNWSDIKPVPGWFGAEDQGAGIAIMDINGNGRPELFILHLDNPSGENRGYYRIGWNMDVNGDIDPQNWGNPIPIPGWFGADNQGGGIAIGDFTGTGRPELVVYHVDNPGGENIAYYRIGRDINVDGIVGSWSEVRQVSGWVGSETQGGGIAAGDINGDGIVELVSFHIDNPAGENNGYYRVTLDLGRSGDFIHQLWGKSVAGQGLRVWKSGRTTELTNGTITYTNGTITIPNWGTFVDQLVMTPLASRGDSGSVIVNAQNLAVGLFFAVTLRSGTPVTSWANRIENVLEALRWSSVSAVPGWFGAENQGADIAVFDINGNGQPDLVVFHIDNPGGENHGYYRIGWNLDGNGNVTGGWSPIMPVPGWFGAEDQGAGIAIVDINGNGRPDLVVFHVDNPGGENHGYYRIGWNLDNNGNVTGGWSPIMPVPGWFGAEDQGAGIAIVDINGNGRPDLVVFHVDNPGGENHGYYRIGWNLDNNGNVTGGWSPIIEVPGWFGAEDQGAGIAVTNLTSNNRPDLLIFHLDNPSGENHGYYRVAFDLMPTGFPARWTVA